MRQPALEWLTEIVRQTRLMILDGSSRRMALTVHGAIVGFGWFVVALPSLVLIEGDTGVRDWFGQLEPSLQGMIGAVVVLCAIPLLWPVYLAIGWYEMQAAQQVERSTEGPALVGSC